MSTESMEARLKRLKSAVSEGKHPMQAPPKKRQKRAEKVATKIIALASESS